MDYANDLMRARERTRRRQSRLRFAAGLLLLAGYWVYRVHIRPIIGISHAHTGEVEIQPESEPLAEAVDKGDCAAVKRLLDSGVSPNSRAFLVGYHMETALARAAKEGHIEIARLLLDRGADVNDSHSAGETALSEAAKAGQTELVRLLISRGADVNANYDYLMILGRVKNRISKSKSETERRHYQETVAILENAGAADDFISLREGQLASILLLLIAAGVFLWAWVRG